ncbi:MAG: hypothetical protein RQ753_06360, partial [Desulfurivibrionaceae bacterium]|nr:hypothetical protein [Desulfurivibrionaceae bacterium]
GIATSAFFATQVASGAAAVSWIVMEWLTQGKPTTLGVASGAIAGLVAITPGAGFVGPNSAIIIGLVAGALCYFAVLSKSKLGYDDALDVVGVHGVGGLWGALATGLFALRPQLIRAGPTACSSAIRPCSGFRPWTPFQLSATQS